MADYSDPLGLLFGGANYFGSPQKSQGLLQLTPQEIERMAAAQSPAFGVFPQMQPYRSQQDIRASANVPVDVARGRVAGTLGLFGDVFNQPIPMVRPLQLLSQAMTGQQKYPDTEYFLNTLPLKSDTPVGDVAGRIGSFAPINPMPAVRGVQKLGGLLGEEMATRLNTGRPILPSLLAEPQSAMFAVEPNPSMAMADESSAMRQQLTDKMQALLAQKKIATSAVDVGSINQQIGELQAQFKSLPAMDRVAREVVVPEITAPVSNLGFYSATEQAAMNLERSKGTGQSFLNDLMNAPDVKNYEIEAMGLDTYLKGKPNVTRQEVQDFIANNRVDVQEVRYGALTPEDQAQKDLLLNRNRQLTDQIATAKLRYEEGGIQYSELRKTISDISKERTGIEESLSAFQGEAPKFGQYQLAGGENYRELLLTLPSKPMDINTAAENYYTQFLQRGGQPDWSQLTSAKKQELISSMPDVAINAPSSPQFSSSHFKDPNILAHMRVNDRIDAEGKKMLLIEEVQSDWHQAGREQGYNNPKEQALAQEKIRALKAEHKRLGQVKELEPSPLERSIISQQRFDLMNQVNELSKVGKSGIPDAPFKDTWYQLALKRAIKEAVDKGYDRIGLTTGKRQIERYTDELRQNVSEINFQTGAKLTPAESAELKGLRQQQTYMTGTERQRYEYLSGQEGAPVNQDETLITAFNGSRPAFTGKVKNGKFIEGPNKALGKTVEEVLGKSIAKQIEEKKTGSLTGDNLTIGGEGMKKYYDEVYPNYLEKYGKKYGAQVGDTTVNVGKVQSKDELAKQLYGNNETYKNLPSEQKRKVDVMFMDMSKDEPVRYLDITPEMRKAIKEGQPLASIEEELAKALA